MTRPSTQPVPPHASRRLRSLAPLALCAVALASVPGCELGLLIGGMAQSYNETASHKVDAEYDGLAEHSFAVVVAADRSIEADFPGLVAELTKRIDERLAENANASGHVPYVEVLGYLYNNPGWAAKSKAELAAALGSPARIIYIDFTEFRLNDPGNAYLWEGAASGSIGVLELDGSMPEDYSYEHAVRVKFPDKLGTGPNDFSRDQVIGVLLKRFVDRTTWLFYQHEEKIMPDY